MAAIEHGIITPTTKDRLMELEQQKAEIRDAIEVASAAIPQLTREQVIFWLEKFRKGDATDPAFQWKVIENFMNAVYLYDDRIRIVYNYTKQGAETVDLAFIEGLDAGAGEVFGVGVPSSTKWTLHEHLLLPRRLRRAGVAVMSTRKQRVKILCLDPLFCVLPH